MDLFAYASIPTLQTVADANGISVRRLRGYRLMAQEPPFSDEEITEIVQEKIYNQIDLHFHRYFYDYEFRGYEWSPKTDRLSNYYLIKDPNDKYKYIGIRWERLHGRKRKAVKLLAKHARKEAVHACTVWNKYAGRPDVLYIHARIGGNNWNAFGGPNLARQPWFLEKTDDLWDSTYCDIFAKISPLTDEQLSALDKSE